MIKTLFKSRYTFLALGITLLICGVFIMTNKTQAYSNFGAGTGYFGKAGGATFNFISVGGGTFPLGFVNRPAFFASSTAEIGEFSEIASVSLLVRNPTAGSLSIRPQVYCVDGGGSRDRVTNTLSLPANQTQFQPLNFFVTPPLLCDSSTLTSLTIDVNSVASEGDYAGNDFIGLTQGVAVHDAGSTATTTYSYNLILGFNTSFATTTSGNPTGDIPVENCPNTSISIGNVDFGEAFCELVVYLFKPSQNSLNSWTNLQDTMEVKAPFSYFYQLTNTLSNQATTTTATVTPLTLTVASGTPMSISVDIFSKSTIERYTTPTSRGIVRSLIKYSLYRVSIEWEVLGSLGIILPDFHKSLLIFSLRDILLIFGQYSSQTSQFFPFCLSLYLLLLFYPYLYLFYIFSLVLVSKEK